MPRLAEARVRFARLVQDQAGTGSVLPLFLLTSLLALGGFAMDVANVWRNGEVMRATADAAAHAGAVALARGQSVDDAVAAAQHAIALNMDPAIFAQGAPRQRAELVRAWHFDAASGKVSEEGTANAISVQLRRSPQDGNTLQTYLLGLIGLGDLSTAMTAVVAVTPTETCSNAAGLFARGAIALDGAAEVGSGYCLHSQTSITLARSVEFSERAHLSMPDLAQCSGFCSDSLSPGLSAAATEANLISTSLRGHVSGLQAAMLGPMADSPLKQAFFAARPLAEDLEPLAEVGQDPTRLHAGAVVQLSKWDFEKLRAIPQGLVYAVSCDPSSPLGPPILEVGGVVGALALRNAALVTNCALHFRGDFDVAGALILSTFEGPFPSISAELHAVLGDPNVGCDEASRTLVMALGDQVLPSELLLSNASMVVDGNVTILPDQSRGLGLHNGFSLHAGGRVDVQGQHVYRSCPGASVAGLPELSVIRFVMPSVPAMPDVLMDDRKLPGKKAKPLPPTPPLPMSKTPPAELMSQADLPKPQVGL